jgi:hypothetical protein
MGTIKVTKRSVGRPRKDEPDTMPVTIRISTKYYKQMKKMGISPTSIFRPIVERYLRKISDE